MMKFKIKNHFIVDLAIFPHVNVESEAPPIKNDQYESSKNRKK